jgi:hypothetical protein
MMIARPETHREKESPSLMALCRTQRLLARDDAGIVRVPFLVRGKLVVPDDVDVQAIERAFEEKDRKQSLGRGPASYVTVGRTQVLREPIIDRGKMTRTDRWQYTVMPAFSPDDVIERDVDALAKELYSLPFDEIETFIKQLARTLDESEDLIEDVAETTLSTSELPNFWHAAAFASLRTVLDAGALRSAVDRELSAWGVEGTRFLDGWVELRGEIFPAEVNVLMNGLFEDHPFEPSPAELRAMPTRQLHITAGNAPQIPLISLLRAFATKSAAVVKSPSGALLPGALTSLLIAHAMPDHPLARHTSIVYWPGGHETTEARLFMPGAFDRIVVWGEPESVLSVRRRAVATKVLTFNPRYAVSFIGKETFLSGGDLEAVAVKSVSDSLIANQKACIASLVHYVEGSNEDVKAYAEKVAAVLARVEKAAPNYVAPHVRGEIKRLERSAFLDAEWYGEHVVVIDHEFPIMRHPMSRLVVIRRVGALDDALAYLHPGVSTVSVHPKSRRIQLRDRIAAAGVSNTVDLGQSGRGFAGMSHDGMLVLSELVDWKNG